MKMLKQTLCGALLGLSLAACGPTEDVEQESTGQAEQPLEAGCVSVDDTLMTTHACTHASNSGDNVNVTASATRVDTAPDISTQHKHYTLTLPAGAEGSVTFTPTNVSGSGTVESVAFYVNKNVALTVVNATTSATVSPLINESVAETGCSLIKAQVYDLTPGTEYIVVSATASGNQVGIVPEYLYNNRDRYYRDQDGDGYGVNTPVYRFACEVNSGYSKTRFDCDDTNPAIFNC
ncbi:DUF859 domain-containing protein [Myxococcus sp. MISCRS1]|uniref:DUF859 domain-containing protein n=1 Tax=Myxococcus TaxID=32 RepID=UPI001CC0F00A|nr:MULTISPECIES: DUF859 domain-containing protein [Myxococcus]BDT38011.1 DUF859 domain-containing protein [Myxococcus sp. MH1]MBZ4396498.1 DUF859 domain-containing protein [Myxococcus sp. AS-1-15]MBZ4411793.1 DUF859 domain-containing protein [Myxococcus sp. XM-1-1-1]MCK8500770.1 DUF859 domain-containing protein [Myxococcus fulvus]MCY1000447.1 DUF859 domain-containing protein [Myxococcus sp. MISCRS1]